MKKIYFPLVFTLPLLSWTAVAATPTPQEQCHNYYKYLQNFVQGQFYESPAGFCAVSVHTDGERIIEADIKEGSVETCAAAVKAFDILLYRKIPTPPNGLCQKRMTFEFKISEEVGKKFMAETAVADNLKNKLHAQLKTLQEKDLKASSTKQSTP